MKKRKNGRPGVFYGLLAMAAAVAAGVICFTIGRSEGRKDASAGAVAACQPPGLTATHDEIEAFFKAWNDPAARAAIGPETAPETVLAEAVRMVLYSEQDGFAGFNAYLNKSALWFTQDQIERVGGKLAEGAPQERLDAFGTVVGFDLRSGAIVAAALKDPRIMTAPAPPPEPTAEPENPDDGGLPHPPASAPPPEPPSE